MANRTKGMIQVGIGQEFKCSEEGGGFIQEMDFVYCRGSGITIKTSGKENKSRLSVVC